MRGPGVVATGGGGNMGVERREQARVIFGAHLYCILRLKPWQFWVLKQRTSRGRGHPVPSIHADVILRWPVTESDGGTGLTMVSGGTGRGLGGMRSTMVPGRGRVIVAGVPGFACANGFCAKAGLRP